MHERTSGEFYERKGECIKMPNRKAEEALDDHSSPGSDVCSSSSESLDFLRVTDLERGLSRIRITKSFGRTRVDALSRAAKVRRRRSGERDKMIFITRGGSMFT